MRQYTEEEQYKVFSRHTGGSDEEHNGITLCSMHHKIFDRGVFKLTSSRKCLVAERAHGTSGFEEWLMRYS